VRAPDTAGLTRRGFLGVLGAGLAATAVVTRPLRALAQQAVDGVVRLGRAYLADHPEEARRAKLVTFLPAVDPDVDIRGQLPALAGRVQRDFAADRVVTVSGWQLSRTEARAAGLVALSA
jgi:hypothetical protein